MVLTLILFTLVNILLAYVDAKKIIKGNSIKHGINAAIYMGIVAIPYFIFHNYFLIAALLFNRLLFFNMFLSLFRKLSVFYMPLKPLSITDILAGKVFGTNGRLMYSIYAIAFIILTVISFI